LDDLTDVSESRYDTFKWHNIVSKYKERPDVLFPVSLFIFAASHFFRNNGSCVQVVPHFFGYESKVSWPIQDDYSKWVLILHHPWIGNVESLKIDDSYVTALKAFLWTSDCPKLVSMEILQKELGWKLNKSAYLSMYRGHNGDTGALREDSQVTEGSNHQQTINAAEEADTECNADLGGDAFRDLPDGGPDYVWNNDYDTAAESAMKKYKLRFYARQTAAQASGAETPFTLIKGDMYTPTNSIGQQQIFIIALHLVALREWTDYWDIRRMSIPRSIPSSYVVKVQGKPGAGKTFILCTTHNITRNVFGKMYFDIATVTTGVAADLICGETHIRGYSTPTERKL
jgi:hypothetical protein